MINFKEFYSDVLEEAYASLINPPSEIRIAAGSEVEKILSGRKKSDIQTIQALQNTIENFESIKRGAVWSQLVSERYPRRIGVPNVKTVLKLKGRNHERAIGKIENGIYYIYWIGTHEEYNKIY